MSLLPILRSLSAPARLVRAFGRDLRGIAAVEFGYIVPVILLMLVGVFEVSRAILMDRRLNLVTTMIADLVGREENMTAADVTAVYKIVGQVMSPFDVSSLKVSIIPVKASSTDATNTRVYPATTNRPSYNGGSQPAKCASYGLTAGLVPEGASVIVVETNYTYTPVFANYIYSSASWSDKAIVSPRHSCVDFDGDNCVSTCF